MVIGHLHITSWRGISIGAVHWYADIHVADKYEKIDRIKLERPRSGKEIKILNDKEKEMGSLYRIHKKGEMTEGFNTEAHAIRLGIKTFKEKYPDGVLFKGDQCSCSAWKNVIYSPDKYKDYVAGMEMLAQEFQSLNGYECKPHFKKLVETIDKAWYKLYNKLKQL